jgi:ABC-type branched-subunit amino acid transport system substrate-binding protein
VFALALLSVSPVRADDVVLGMSAAFSGPSGGLGAELYRGAQACFLEVNAGGGIHGHKIVLKACDDGYDPDKAIANTLQFIQKDQVFALFGYVGTPTGTRILPLLRRHADRETLLFYPFTGAQTFRQPPYGEYVFNLRASYRQETEGLVNGFLDIGRTRIAVFYQIDAYGRNGWEGVRIALNQHKLKMVGEATYPRGTPFRTSMKRQVESLRERNPDAIICIGAYAACAAFIRDARDAGWDVPIANVSFVGSESLLWLLHRHGNATGRNYTSHLINSQVVPSYHQKDLAAVRDYRALMKRHNPSLPPGLQEKDYTPLEHSFVGFEGFLDARLLVEILNRLPREKFEDCLRRKPGRTPLRELVEKCEDLDIGLPHKVSFGPRRHQGLDKVYFTVVEGGQFVVLDDWRRWKK